MAALGVRAAIAHAAVDASFRRSLLNSPADACYAAGYEMTADELASVHEVIADDAFGVTVASSRNLPELFEEATHLSDDLAPMGEVTEDARAI